MFKQESLPNVKIVNGLSNRASIVEKVNYFKLIGNSFRYILLLTVIVFSFVMSYLFKIYYDENAFLQNKISQNAYDVDVNRDNLLLDNLSLIIAKEGKIPYEIATKYATWALESASKEKINPFLVIAVMSVESNFNFQAQSKANAIGLMQVIYEWHKEKVPTQAALYDPKTNIYTGAKILREYLQRSNDNEVEALLRYNGSLGMDPVYAVKVLAKKELVKHQIINSLMTNKTS